MDPEQPTSRSIWLWDDNEYEGAGTDGFRPWLDAYPCPDAGDGTRGAVLVMPGGGYCMRAPHEAAPIASRFRDAGIHGFVCHYSVSPRRHPQPLRDASRALRLVRQRAPEWGVNPDRIAVLGFSAGGHLTASLGVHYGQNYLKGNKPIDRVANRPDALVLCYAVITAFAHGHKGSLANLLGADATEEQRRAMSLELHVTGSTPPTFLWHTVEDEGVPVENALLFAQSLRRCSVPFEMHLYPKGRHGLGLAPEDPHVATWPDLCIQWLKTMGW